MTVILVVGNRHFYQSVLSLALQVFQQLLKLQRFPRDRRITRTELHGVDILERLKAKIGRLAKF